MNINLDLAEYREEIDRLEDMAEKLVSLGMEEKVEGYKPLIADLRLRLDKLELQELI